MWGTKVQLFYVIIFIFLAQHHLTVAKSLLREQEDKNLFQYTYSVLKNEGYLDITKGTNIQLSRHICDITAAYLIIALLCFFKRITSLRIKKNLHGCTEPKGVCKFIY